MKTALYEEHKKRGAKMVDFGGWEMPLQYTGILHEHKKVRESVGVFDVSHMGRVDIKGPEAEKFVDFISTNKMLGKRDLTGTYTVFATESGGCVDDAIIFRFNAEHFFTIVNAGNRDKDLAHIKSQAKSFDVEIEDYYSKCGILAIQGPDSRPLVAELFPVANELKFMRFDTVHFSGHECILSNSGYTGSPGFELIAPNEAMEKIWTQLFERGEKYGLEPIGLGARDTLRLEMGFALYGHELSEEIAPTESVSRWTVKMDKEDFLGKKALEELEGSDTRRKQYGVRIMEKGIPRQGYEVYKDENVIGSVTSGNQAPSINTGVAIIIASEALEEGDTVQIKIRNKLVNGKVVKLPFYKN